MKKILSLLLCIITCFLIFTLCTPVALAASYSGNCNGTVSWTLDTADGVLTISGSGDMGDYSMSSAPGWDRYQNYIKSVVFESGVSTVGEYTFYNGGKGYKYKKLTSVNLGTVQTIDKYAFRGCAYIETITSANSVSSIGDYAFAGCSSLTSFPFSSVTAINNGAFGFCANITELNFSTKLRGIGSAAFENCTSVSSVTLPVNINTISDRAFAGCSSITEVIFNSRSVNTVGMGIFNGAGADSGVTLTIANNIVTIPSNIFSYFSKLTTVLGGTAVVNINDNAFAHTGITSFAISASTSNISNTAFADTASLAAFTVDSDNDYYSANADGILMNRAGTQIIRYPGGKQNSSYTLPSNVTSISEGAFRECTYLEEFTAGSSILDIPGYCFMNSPALTTVSLASTIKSLGTYSFTNCSSLSSVSMPAVDTINHYAFAECDSLSDLTTSSVLKTIGNFAYSGCDGITRLTVSSGTTTIGKYAFYNCRNLTEISIASSVTEISEGAFALCPSLTSVSLKKGLKTVGQYAFVECPALKSVRVPSSVTDISKFAFGYEKLNSAGSQASFVQNFRLYCTTASAAYTYAANSGMPYSTFTETASDTTVIDLSEPSDTNISGKTVYDFLNRMNISETSVIYWFINIFYKIYNFFVSLIRG